MSTVLVLEAERVAAARRLKTAWEFYAEDRRLIEERRHEETKKEEREAEFAAVMATEEQVVAMREGLDRYDTASVEALMENRHALDSAEDRIADLRVRADTLPDGRRVFKSADGGDVFDEHGVALGREVADPDTIHPKAPSYEEFALALKDHERLEQQHDNITAYQMRLDDARKQIEHGVSKHDLDKMDADLKAAMPDVVRQKLAAADGKATQLSVLDQPASPTARTLQSRGSVPQP